MVYPISKLTIRPICMLWVRKVEGLENIEKGKPFIIASNHQSYCDSLLVPAAVLPGIDRKIHALVNSYYWKPFVTRIFLNLWEAIPVNVDKKEKSNEKNSQSIEKAVNHLKNKELVMIFPEGKRSDGKLKKAYTGVAKIALMAKVPVLPVGIIDSNKVLPKGKTFPRFTRCEVKIGKLMYFEKYYNKKGNEKTYQNITRQIMGQIAKLIGQKYKY